MNDSIKKISLYSKDTRDLLFNKKDKYIIPVYQRGYDWTENEIIQFIDDINDYKKNNSQEYYIGTLIVNKNKNIFEVVDGQQRLTTLFLLYSFLEIETNKSLSFEFREKSDNTLNNLSKETEECDINLIKGKNIIEEKFQSEKIDKEVFKEKLKNVYLFRIELPPNTDLNRYFEIMNTRGEQLEQTDILKAQLMSYLNKKECVAFSKIWDAVSNMTGYVQMNFEKSDRGFIFGQYWSDIIDNPFKELCKENVDTGHGESIKEILQREFKEDNYNYTENMDEKVKFESIINFPYFLEHVLKVYVDSFKLKNKDNENSKLYNELLDDKKLLDMFNNVIENTDNINKHDFAIGFINCLITCRFLFDKNIIKREYKKDDQNGMWSLKTLHTSGQQSKKKAYYGNTYFAYGGYLRNFMLQSCLRVSYTSPKVMHWITFTLEYLYNNTDKDICHCLDKEIKNFAISEVKKVFLDNQDYMLGVNTPHIALNFLDYLLWENDSKKAKPDYTDFIFEFRNSVEHWYPRNIVNNLPLMEDVDTFGNLCLVQREVNSKFSNNPPSSKKSIYNKQISKGSLKLRLMSENTENDMDWRNKQCKIHEEKMLNLLKNAK